jgi:uncharacterized protein (DUF58 family)
VSTIDWRASARLSTARGDHEFVVRERFADEAPRVVVVVDRRPSMALYPAWSPWLSKPQVIRAATTAIADSAIAARAAVGYLDWQGGSEAPYWVPPRGRNVLPLIQERDDRARFDGEPGSLARCLAYLSRSAAGLGPGSFVFVLSDFLDPPPPATWIAGVARRWEIVPVLIQDRTWEQSFPSLGPVILAVADPETRVPIEARLSRSEARAERERRECARIELLTGFASLGLDPVLLDDSEPGPVLHAFYEWAERRRRALWRRR